jgi:hypothetical protein
MEEVKIEVFILFDKEDRDLFLELKKHLASLEMEGLIVIRDEDQIAAGTDRRQAIDRQLQKASFILLLVSAHFMASGDSYALAKQSLATHKERVVPVLLHAVDWEYSVFGQLVPLPTNKEPISSWTNRHAAFLDVVKGIRGLIEKYKPSMAQKVEPVDTSLVTITTPDGRPYRTEVPANTPVTELLHDILGQWLPLTLGTTGSQRFSLRPISFGRKSTLHTASLAAKTNLELVAEALSPNEPIKLRIEDDKGIVYTASVPLNTPIGELVDDFLGTESHTEEVVVRWMLSATRAKQLRLEASLYYQGVCDDALLRVFRVATVAEE